MSVYLLFDGDSRLIRVAQVPARAEAPLDLFFGPGDPGRERHPAIEVPEGLRPDYPPDFWHRICGHAEIRERWLKIDARDLIQAEARAAELLQLQRQEIELVLRIVQLRAVSDYLGGSLPPIARTELEELAARHVSLVAWRNRVAAGEAPYIDARLLEAAGQEIELA